MLLFFWLLALCRRPFFLFALFSLIFEQFVFVSLAYADLPIAADGSTNTQVLSTASGIDQINIAAPSASGLSHNKFLDYNVNSSGQIINNFSGSSTAVVSTEIGGLVNANPNLRDSGSASVILNEVTSTNSSVLRGYAEIAGSRADLIIANPNGISCLGCGFINTSRLLMVAGSSNFDALGNLGFDLRAQENPNLYVPLITVDGLGLDATRVSSAEIIASSIKLLSSISASSATEIRIGAGGGRYDYASKSFTPGASASDTSRDLSIPVFAIDAASLAEISAGRIFLIATKEGVGVKMLGEILAADSLNIEANGDVLYQKISAGKKAEIQANKKFDSTNSSAIISAPEISIFANELNNFGLILAGNLSIKNAALLNNFGQIEALSLKLQELGSINNFSEIFAQNLLEISGKNLNNKTAAQILSPNNYPNNFKRKS